MDGVALRASSINSRGVERSETPGMVALPLNVSRRESSIALRDDSLRKHPISVRLPSVSLRSTDGYKWIIPFRGKELSVAGKLPLAPTMACKSEGGVVGVIIKRRCANFGTAPGGQILEAGYLMAILAVVPSARLTM